LLIAWWVEKAGGLNKGNKELKMAIIAQGCGSNTLQDVDGVHYNNPMALRDDVKMHNHFAKMVGQSTGVELGAEVPSKPD
jgi:hypothetical protein